MVVVIDENVDATFVDELWHVISAVCSCIRYG